MLFRDEPLEFRDVENAANLKLRKMFAKDVSVDPGNITATTSLEVAVTVPGVEVGDYVVAQVPASLHNDIAFSGCRVSAANTVQIRLSNIDNTNAVDDTARTWRFLVFDLT